MCNYKDKCHLHIDAISKASLLQHTLGFPTQNETEWKKKTHIMSKLLPHVILTHVL